MTDTGNGMDGDPRIARVELGIVDEGILGGHRWRYRLHVGAREEEHEMEEMTRALSLFEASLRGALHVMDRVPEGYSLIIEAPESPLIVGLSRWIHKWLGNGWLTRDGDPVCHRKLWTALWSLSVQRKVEWVAAPGHQR